MLLKHLSRSLTSAVLGGMLSLQACADANAGADGVGPDNGATAVGAGASGLGGAGERGPAGGAGMVGTTDPGGAAAVSGGAAGGGAGRGGGAGVAGGAAGVAGSGGMTGGGSDAGGSGRTGGSMGATKPYRLIWTSDFPPIPVTNSDPDDVQTIVRLILYSNEIEVEGFIAAAGTYDMVADKSNFDKVWDAYEQVHANLAGHDPRYPTPEHMRSITYEGKGNNNGVSIQWGCNKQSATSLIGEGKQSEGSMAIIAAADKDDPRPLWIGVAGGPREVAQAIWDVKNTRSSEEATAFIRKLRVFLIACQDGTHEYIMNEPDLFVVESKSTFGSFFCGGDANCNQAWVTNNIIENHGPLGALYPDHGCCTQGMQEGDTPAFMHLVSGVRGINDPEDPSQPGWGGRYRQEGTKWLDTGGGGDSIREGREAYQEEFAERADWMVQ